MDVRSTIHKQRRIRRLFRLSVTVGVMMTVLLVALYLIRQSRQTFLREVAFDPVACVRLFDISRVYRIRAADHDPTELWFATAEGIRVLDTETMEWRRYGMDHGLTSETIVDVCFADGTPRVATWNGVLRFDTLRQRFEPLHFSAGLGGTRILAIESVPGRGVFFSIDARGLFHLPPGDTIPRQLDVPATKASARITCLEHRPERGVLVGVEGRKLFEYSPAHDRFTPFAFSRAGSGKTYIWDVLFRDGGMWVATSDDGLWHADSVGDTLRPVEDFPAKGAYVFAGEEDGFFCGTPFGLWRYHETLPGGAWVQLVHPEEKSATDFQVFTLANTPELLWYGSMDLGAGYLRKERVEWMPLRAGLSSPNVVSIVADDSLFWTAYGYDGNHIDRFSVDDVQYDRNYNQHDGILDHQIQSLLLDSSRLYYGGFGCFGWLDRGGITGRYYGRESSLPHGDIADIVTASDSTLFLASHFGLVRYDVAADTFHLYEATEGLRLTCIVPDEGKLWLGTLARGLRLFDRATAKVTDTWLEGSMRVVAVGVAGEGEVVAVTKFSGLYRIDRHRGTVARVPVPGGLIAAKAREYDTHVMAARFIDGRLWLGTRNRGCAIYDLAGDRWSTMTYYDGLVSDQVLSFHDTQRFIWVGCDGGVNRLEKTYINRTLDGDGTNGEVE
jgi:ligand-binding sensor domain-containing protein